MPSSGDVAGRAGHGLDQSRLAHLAGCASSRAAIAMRKVFARHFNPLELTLVEFSILMRVAANAEVNQQQIGATLDISTSRHLDISAPNPAVTLDRTVERVRGTRDRRSMRIHRMASGRELVQRAGKIAATIEAPALRMVSGAERARLIELLMKVAGGRALKRCAPR